MSVTIAEIDAEIERLEPLARADVLARRVKGFTNYWRGSEEKYLAALKERERAQQREEDALELREAQELSEKVQRLHAAVAKLREARKQQRELDDEIAGYPEAIRSAANAPKEKDAETYSHPDPEIQEVLSRKLAEVIAVRRLIVQRRDVSDTMLSAERRIALMLQGDEVLESALPRDIAAELAVLRQIQESD